MKGLLTVNHYLNIPAINGTLKELAESAERQSLELVKMTNAELISALGASVRSAKRFLKKEKITFALFWDKDIRLCELLEECGIRVFNRSSAIWICDDKSLTYTKLCGAGIRMPQTVLLPKCYYPALPPEEFILSLERELGYPMIAKEVFGSMGEQVYLAEDRDSLIEIIKNAGTKGMIFQRFVKSSRGRDMRIYIVGGRVCGAMIRSSETDFRANASLGGKCEPFTPDRAQAAVAKKVCRILGLDFAGVDLLFAEDGEPILCEVNSNAQFVKLNEICSVNIADDIIRYIKKECEKT